MEVTIQNQIYIWCGVLTALWVILALCFIVLCVYVKKNSNQRKPEDRGTVFLQQKKAPQAHKKLCAVYGEEALKNGSARIGLLNFDPTTKNELASYFGSADILPGEELDVRGFKENNPIHQESNNHLSRSESMIFASDYPPKQAQPRQSGKPRNILLNNNHHLDAERRRGDVGSDNPNFMY